MSLARGRSETMDAAERVNGMLSRSPKVLLNPTIGVCSDWIVGSAPIVGEAGSDLIAGPAPITRGASVGLGVLWGKVEKALKRVVGDTARS